MPSVVVLMPADLFYEIRGELKAIEERQQAIAGCRQCMEEEDYDNGKLLNGRVHCYSFLPCMVMLDH